MEFWAFFKLVPSRKWIKTNICKTKRLGDNRETPEVLSFNVLI